MTTTPLTSAQWMTALAAEGVTAVFASGWKTAGRDSATGKPFGPVFGVVIHHTAGTNSLSVVKDGRSDLPGPLAHAHLAKDGKLTQLSVRRTNHAGTFAQNSVDAVKAESSTHPKPAAAEPVDGNDCFYGLEIENKGNGQDPYPAVQFDQAVRWAAAICRFHGWTAHSVIGHKEGTRRKIDPSFDMALFRTAVAERLAHSASWTKGATTTPEAAPVAKPKAYTDVVEADFVPAPAGTPVDTNPHWTIERYLKFIAEKLISTETRLIAIEKKLDAS